MISLKRSKWLFIITAFISVVFFLYLYQPQKKIENIKPSYLGTSKDFIKNSDRDYNSWNTKTIELTGEISSVLEDGLMLDDFIYCQLKENQNKVTKNQKITIKGIVLGYDEMLNELKMTECIIK